MATIWKYKSESLTICYAYVGAYMHVYTKYEVSTSNHVTYEGQNMIV